MGRDASHITPSCADCGNETTMEIEMTETTKINATPDAAGRNERVVIWLRKQWRDSLAKSIWGDMTPFGRATLWLPIWMLCWLIMPVVLLLAGIVVPLVWMEKHLQKLPPIFFAR